MDSLFRSRPPKLIYFHANELEELVDENHEDVGVVENHEGREETDRLPRDLYVRDFDLLCFAFAIFTYAIDVLSDSVVAVAHFYEGRVWSCIFISLFFILPSLVLNAVSLVWWLDDSMEKKEREKSQSTCSSSLVRKVVACIFQAGPILWYVNAIRAGLRFRRAPTRREKLRWFVKMVQADRDASLLRFFEAFLESAPQLLVQGFLVADYVWKRPRGEALPNWIPLQIVSIACSLLSICWSISAQHRSLRMSRRDKENMYPHESFLQLLWRFFTIGSRYISFILFLMCFRYWLGLVVIVHFFISLLHVAALQSVDTGTQSGALEVGLLLINAAIHTFAPFNMADGPTRWRYTVAYVIEFFENLLLVTSTLVIKEFTFVYKYHLAAAAMLSYFAGILIMLLYYGCFHPNRRRHQPVSTNVAEERELH